VTPIRIKKIIWRKDESHTCNSNNNRWITQDEYDKKASELKQGQYELNHKLKRVIEADESYSITLITLLKFFIKNELKLPIHATRLEIIKTES